MSSFVKSVAVFRLRGSRYTGNDKNREGIHARNDIDSAWLVGLGAEIHRLSTAEAAATGTSWDATS